MARTLLSEYDLSPAPGYYSALFHELPNGQIIESAKRHAAMQAELGNTEVFIAAGVGGIRVERPAVGAGADPAILAKVIDGLGAAAAITAEGMAHAPSGMWLLHRS